MRRSPLRRALPALALAWALGAAPALPAETPQAERPETETATFSMYCYWTGEATLGRVSGVVASRIGHWAGREIVQVDYDPDQTSLPALTRALERQRSLYSVLVTSDEAQENARAALGKTEVTQISGEPHFIPPKHSLRTLHPELIRLDLTERQAIRLNSWSYFGGAMPDVLSPEQKRRWAQTQ